MNQIRTKRHTRLAILAAVFISVLLTTIVAESQYRKSELKPPPSSEFSTPTGQQQNNDSVELPMRVRPTVPRGYEDYVGGEYAADLRTPSNIKTEAVYDPALGMYVLSTKIGD